MTEFILDASMAVAWCIEDEANPAAQAVMDMLRDGRAYVPPLWPYEIANALASAERHGRITAVQAEKFVQLYRDLPIEIDPGEPDILNLVVVARTSRLSAYNASYLVLSLRRGLPLATRDRQLAGAARAAGVQLI